jgi:PAS domain S-box-containing protein
MPANTSTTTRKLAVPAHEREEWLSYQMIDALPAAIYTTDAQGRLTYFNRAAIELSGRTPDLGTDQWCVSWKLYRPDGTPLPHDMCPMAVALKEGRAVHGEVIIVERPDGKRCWVEPHPAPLFDESGKVIGGKKREPGLPQSLNPPKTRSSAKTWMALSRVGMRAPSGCSATRPRKRLAIRLQC